MYGKYKVNNKVCYMANALALVDLSKAKIGDIVKLYRYETEEELYFCAVENNIDTTPFIWDIISTEESFSLYQALGLIPSYEELDTKTLIENRDWITNEDIKLLEVV